jgi:hypothetical protein
MKRKQTLLGFILLLAAMWLPANVFAATDATNIKWPLVAV